MWINWHIKLYMSYKSTVYVCCLEILKWHSFTSSTASSYPEFNALPFGKAFFLATVLIFCKNNAIHRSWYYKPELLLLSYSHNAFSMSKVTVTFSTSRTFHFSAIWLIFNVSLAMAVHTYMPSELMYSSHMFTTSQMNTTPALQTVAFCLYVKRKGEVLKDKVTLGVSNVANPKMKRHVLFPTLLSINCMTLPTPSQVNYLPFPSSSSVSHNCSITFYFL